MLSINTLGVNTREREKLFKLKDSVDTGKNGDELAMNQFRLEIRRKFPTIRGGRFWSSLTIAAMGKTT